MATKIQTALWGKGPAGEDVHTFTLTNASGASVVLSEMGAGIIEINVPDRDGNLADVALGYKDLESYFADGPYMGKTPGRYANRIDKGRFTLDGKTYSLATIGGKFHLHGGPGGFGERVWEGRISDSAVEFRLVEKDMQCGYPGDLEIIARYRWDDDCSLTITYLAATSAPTVLNVTNHAYFNLKGEGRGDILGHILTINASDYVVTDEAIVPTGEIATVAGTPMDFLVPKPVGRDIFKDFPALNTGKGYDSCWVLDGRPGELNLAAVLEEPESGRVLEVLTTQPAIQLYCGNWLSGCPLGRSGTEYGDYYGAALECQHFPDSPNHPEFPSTVLRPGEEFSETIVYRFSVREAAPHGNAQDSTL